MSSWRKLVRDVFQDFKPYSSAREEFTGEAAVFLDANESPFGEYNRYPDPLARKLKNEVSKWRGVTPSEVFIGNGSDEAIDLLYRMFCEPGKDCAVGLSPSYGMYEVSAKINSVKYYQVPLDSDFQMDENAIQSAIDKFSPKLLLICSPNNPTGNSLSREAILRLMKNEGLIVIIDEAYIDFSDQPSLISEIHKCENLVVLQTLSKGPQAAGLRVGMAFANPDLVQLLNSIKPPYNVSQPAQTQALKVLLDRDKWLADIDLILLEKQKLAIELVKLADTIRIYPSDANFLLLEVKRPAIWLAALEEHGIIIRDRRKDVPNTVRITVGKPEENLRLLEVLKSIQEE